MKRFLGYVTVFFQAFLRKAARTNLRNKALRTVIVASTATAGLSGCVVHIGHHDSEGASQRHTSHQSLSLSADNISRLYIDSGAGSVDVKGVEGARSIQVSADIISGREDGSDVVFTLERDGGTAQLVGKRRSGSGIRFGHNNVSVNMTVIVPAELALRIDDGAGSLVVRHIDNDVSIDDGSGSLSVQDVVGDVNIKDGSGWIEVNQVDGKVSIDDNSGAMSVEQVTGMVNIDDGSGPIDVQDVTNDVVISDGSGGISVARVSYLNIIDAGSGRVSIVDVDHNQSGDLEKD